MKKLQPFGDVPKKLTEQLRRSFVASRTFAQALLEGKQIVNKISKVTKASFYMVLYLRIFQLVFCWGAAKSFPFVLLEQIRPPVLWQDAKPSFWSLDMFFAMWISNLLQMPLSCWELPLQTFFCSQLMNVSLNFYQFSTRFPWLKKAAIFIMGGYPMRLWWWDRDAVLSWRIFW